MASREEEKRRRREEREPGDRDAWIAADLIEDRPERTRDPVRRAVEEEVLGEGEVHRHVARGHRQDEGEVELLDRGVEISPLRRRL